MKSIIGLAALGAAVIFSHVSMAEDATQICAAPLREALMTVKETGAASEANAARTAWQCSFQFSNHDDAINSGLNIGTVVYGVPLKVGGTFDSKKVEQWKNEKCSRSAMNEAFSQASYNYLREVAPGAMSAYVACLDRMAPKNNAIECSLSKGPAALTVKWRRSEGEELSASPKIVRVMVTNGKCEPGLSQGQEVIEGGIGTPCTADSKSDLMVMVATTRGICTAVMPYEKKVYSIAGDLALTGDREIVSDVVNFAPGSKIVTNGNTLRIQAAELEVGEGAKIVSVDRAGSPREPAEPGLSGGALVMNIAAINGSDLTIDLSGEDGAKGVRGTDGVQGVHGINARGRGLQGLRGCGGGNDSTAGGPGTPGSDGGPGGAGGNGGVIVVHFTGTDRSLLSRLAITGLNGQTLPGHGGEGGDPGIGGPGGKGGAGGEGHNGCGGRPGSPNGPKGADGAQGPSGLDGKPGSITMD